MHFNHLPNEILLAIINVVPPDDFLRLVTVNHKLRYLSTRKLSKLSDAKRRLYRHGEILHPVPLNLLSMYPELPLVLRRYTFRASLSVDVEDETEDEEEDDWGREGRPLRPPATQELIDIFLSKSRFFQGRRKLIDERRPGIRLRKNKSD